MKRFFVGVAMRLFGPSACAVWDVSSTPQSWPETGTRKHLVLRYLQRFEPGTTAEMLTSRLKTMLQHHDMRLPGYAPPALVLDATECGRPILEYCRRQRLDPVSLILSESGHITRGAGALPDVNEIHVPWRECMTTMQTLYSNGSAQNASGLPLAHDFQTAMVAYQDNGPGAWRENIHSELLRAAAVAVWVAEWGQEYAIGILKAAAKPIVKLRTT